MSLRNMLEFSRFILIYLLRKIFVSLQSSGASIMTKNLAQIVIAGMCVDRMNNSFASGGSNALLTADAHEPNIENS